MCGDSAGNPKLSRKKEEVMRKFGNNYCSLIGYLALAGVLVFGAAILAQAWEGHAGQVAQSKKPGKGAVQVLKRAKLGTTIEDLAYISSGPFAKHIALIDGYEVRGFPVATSSDRAIRTFFSLLDMDINTPPRGIAYIETERLFAFLDVTDSTKLRLTDHLGHAQATRTLQYLGGEIPAWVEGLEYLPPTAALYPDHLIVCANYEDWDNNWYTSRLVIFRRDGQAVAEIYPPAWADDILYSVAFKAPDRLLIGGEFFIDTIDFAGSSVVPAIYPEEYPEGLAQVPDGRIVATEGAKLRFYDSNLVRLPQDDRDAGTGAGLIFPHGTAWNSDTGQHLVLAFTEESNGDMETTQVAALSSRFDSGTRVVDLGLLPYLPYIRKRGMTYMPDEHRIAVALRRWGAFPAEIALYDGNGAMVETINIAVALTGAGSPSDITYIPGWRQFAVVASLQPTKLKIIDRTGAFVRDIDFSSIGIGYIGGCAYADPEQSGAGQFLVFDWYSTRACLTDFNGNLLAEFDYREELGLLDVLGACAITSGRHAGAFAVVDEDSSQLVIFRLGDRRH
jgi:hypothetical protein